MNLRDMAGPLCVIGVLLVVTACSRAEEQSPAAFSPTREQIQSDQHIARCNTVHSLTLPEEVRARHGIPADDETAVLTCSLQTAGDVPQNLAADVSGTSIALTGRRTALEFREILENDAISYLTTFPITARSEIRFQILMTDPRSGETYSIDLLQRDLPGRR